MDERRDMAKRLMVETGLLAVALVVASILVVALGQVPAADAQEKAEEGSQTQVEQKASKEVKGAGKDKGAMRKALLNPTGPEMTAEAPATYKVKFETSKGDVVIQVTRDLSPLGADRFYNLVQNGFYDEVRFFRVISGFMAQFGVSGDPEIAKAWINAGLKDEPVKGSNTRGTLTYAMRGSPNSRTTQLFINFGNNAFLDKQRFAPFGEVVEGMEVVDSFYAEYGEGAPRGKGPDQGAIQSRGNEYLTKDFPKLDYIKKAYVIK
jgi:peptidyl-prolyl cis-trans isomerase A (cyclophilin A)